MKMGTLLKRSKRVMKRRMLSEAGKQNREQKRIRKPIRKNNIKAADCNKKYTLLQKEVFNIFVASGEIVEVRMPKVFGTSHFWEGYAKGNVSGYFDNFISFKKAVKDLIRWQQNNIYFTLQVIDPRLIGRAYNRLKAADKSTSDKDVLFYRWIPVDIDPVRPAGISSSDSELQKAIELRDLIKDYIFDATEYTHMITAVSGNGAHILIRLPKDLPISSISKKEIKSFLERLDQMFSNKHVKIDTEVFNPSRIWKLYGSKAMKGEEVPACNGREALIYRDSYIDDLGGLA